MPRRVRHRAGRRGPGAVDELRGHGRASWSTPGRRRCSSTSRRSDRPHMSLERRPAADHPAHPRDHGDALRRLRDGPARRGVRWPTSTACCCSRTPRTSPGWPGASARCSDAAAFSFFTNKNMTTAEGGMVIVPRRGAAAAGPAAAVARDDGEHTGPRPRPRGRLRRRRVRPQLPDGRAARRRWAWSRSSGCRRGTTTRRDLTGRYRRGWPTRLPAGRRPVRRRRTRRPAHIMPVLLPAGRRPRRR